MLNEITYPPSGEYRTGSDWEPVVFHMDALLESNQLDLLLGYFSSSAISVLAPGFAKFLSNGGKVRMVVNHILSEKDKEAILQGQITSETAYNFTIEDVRRLKASLDEYGKHFFECLAWLISSQKIRIKAIKPKTDRGISHYKSGIFSDGKNQVRFKSSCNFTASGLLENLEELGIRCSWKSDEERHAIAEYQNYFEEIFNERADFVEYVPIHDVEIAIQNESDRKDLHELLIQEEQLVRKKRERADKVTVKKAFERANTVLEKYLSEPRFPYPSGVRDYQVEAYQNWVGNGYKGIFAMATGTGKTITSLNCLLNQYKKTNTYKAIITVPTTALLEQWKKECSKFNFSNIIVIRSKENWNNNLSFFNTATKLINTSFIVIVTYASFIRPKFQSHFKLLPKETLLIADEVHNMGSPSISKLLPNIHLEKRIGLSATPSRKYDAVGNVLVETFFNDKPPYVFSYSMKQALEINWLCKYAYYPHIVYLTDEELEDYIKISKQLLKYLDAKTGLYKDCKEVESLLLKRKRIIHKAFNKKTVFQQVLKEEFSRRGNLKYTLVYVPEGVETDYSVLDEHEENEDESNLINEYTKIIRDTDDSIMVKQYTSKTKDRNEVINDFEGGSVHVLTSMKCLDEGVDIPRSELAIFCSSTGNPRQFIQRRGRILRTHTDKTHAVIHDLVVVPQISSDEGNYQMERNLVKKELERVVDFSYLSMNKIDTYEELKNILDYYNLNLNDLIVD